MILVDPICAHCYGPMVVVTVHHKNGHTTFHPHCPGCVTNQHLDLADLPMPERDVGGRHLRAVR